MGKSIIKNGHTNSQKPHKNGSFLFYLLKKGPISNSLFKSFITAAELFFSSQKPKQLSVGILTMVDPKSVLHWNEWLV